MKLVLILNFFSIILLNGVCSSTSDEIKLTKTFVIDYDNNQFLKDGLPYRYVSGSFHYFRTPQVYWADRLKKMKEAGLNCVQTYIEWSSHEPEPNEFRFSDDLNITLFFNLAQKQGLDVILRIGPYIDAERDMGGLPYWLLKIHPHMGLRKNELGFLTYVHRWFSKLLPMIIPYLYKNGGPIFMVQIENEYGSTKYCEQDYKSSILNMVRRYLHNDTILFTVDGYLESFLECGSFNDSQVLTTIDFGVKTDARKAFQVLRKYQKSGPLVNSEFYSGWLDHWAYPHETVSVDEFAYALDCLLQLNASVNIYMFHGGTSFGFKSGSNLDINFKPNPTSYDYDAPLNEAGDPTPKYFAIRDVISKHRPLPKLPIPKPKVKFSFGPIQLIMLYSFDEIVDQLLDQKVFSTNPMTFEKLSVQNGFVLYSTKIDFIPTNPTLLKVDGLNDRALVIVDRIYQGSLSRSENIATMPIVAHNGSVLEILVENQGRICYGEMIKEFKGITGQVSLGSVILKNWKHLFIKDWEKLQTKLSKLSKSTYNQTCNNRYNLPAIYMGNFSGNNELLDSFLNLNQFGKGVAYLNGHCLGRYWPKIGPQVNLYTPGSWFIKNSVQTVVIFELYKTNCDQPDECFINFSNQSNIDSSTPYSQRDKTG